MTVLLVLYGVMAWLWLSVALAALYSGHRARQKRRERRARRIASAADARPGSIDMTEYEDEFAEEER